MLKVGVTPVALRVGAKTLVARGGHSAESVKSLTTYIQTHKVRKRVASLVKKKAETYSRKK